MIAVFDGVSLMPDLMRMDAETINLLKTICVAGGVRPAFDGTSNARLEQLANIGLIVSLESPTDKATKRSPRRFYRPTELGRAVFRKLSDEDTGC
jgi:hypothetical protein